MTHENEKKEENPSEFNPCFWLVTKAIF